MYSHVYMYATPQYMYNFMHSSVLEQNSVRKGKHLDHIFNWMYQTDTGVKVYGIYTTMSEYSDRVSTVSCIGI